MPFRLRRPFRPRFRPSPRSGHDARSGPGAGSRHFGLGRPGPRVLGLAVLLALVLIRATDPAPFRYLRTRTFDLYQTLQPREIASRPVVIVAIDDRSLEALGQWPWPRTLLAQMVERLFEHGAALVAFDIVFAEPDRTSPARVAETLPGLDPETRARLIALPSNSAVLAEAMRLGPVVLGQGVRGPGAADGGSGGAGAAAAAPSMALIGQDPRSLMPRYGPVLANLPVLDQAATGRGVFALEPEDDGVVRRVPMVLNAQGTLWPALSTEILRVAAGVTTIGVRARAPGGGSDASALGIEGLIVRPWVIPTDARGRLWVHFAPHDPEKYVSAVDLLTDPLPEAARDRIAGRIALIGASAVGLLDVKNTPISPTMPGVEVHAQVIETLVDGTALHRTRLADAIEVVLALGGGLVMIALVPMVGATVTLALLIGGIGATVSASWIAFSEHLTLIDPVFPSLVAVALHILLGYLGHAREESRRRLIRTAFNHYMAPAMVERLAEDPGRLRLGGETRDLTLMFCDIRGFTRLSEQMDAASLTRLINRFLTPMSEVILAHGGTIDKYIGDCIMAFWNAPLDDPRHARHAAEAALAMIDRLSDLNQALADEARAEGRPAVALRIGIGLNTGLVSVGNMGSDQRFDYSVLGDPVNLASRLEGLSKVYGVTLLLGEDTARGLDDLPVCELDRIRVRGRQTPARVYTLLGDAEAGERPAVRALIAAQAALLAAMQARDWTAAAAHLAEARACARAAVGADFETLHALYQARLDACRADPPGVDWDGVFQAVP